MVSLKIERKLVLDSLCPCKLNNSYAKFNNIEGIRNSLHKLFEIISSAEKTSTNEYFNKDERQRCAEYYIDLWFNAEISVATLAVNNHTLHKATHFSTWIDQAQLAIKSIMAIPVWRNTKNDECGNIKPHKPSSSPLTLGVVWETMQKEANASPSEIPLYYDVNFLLSKGTVSLAEQDAWAESMFPVFFVKDTTKPEEYGKSGQVLKIRIEAVRYKTLKNFINYEGLLFPHLDCVFVPVGDVFLNSFKTAAKFWIEKENVVWPKDVALRWKLETATGENYKDTNVNGSSAGLVITLLMGKVLANLPENSKNP